MKEEAFHTNVKVEDSDEEFVVEKVIGKKHVFLVHHITVLLAVLINLYYDLPCNMVYPFLNVKLSTFSNGIKKVLS